MPTVSRKTKPEITDRLIWLNACFVPAQVLYRKLPSFDPIPIEKLLTNFRQILVLGLGCSISSDSAPQILVV